MSNIPDIDERNNTVELVKSTSPISPSLCVNEIEKTKEEEEEETTTTTSKNNHHNSNYTNTNTAVHIQALSPKLYHLRQLSMSQLNNNNSPKGLGSDLSSTSASKHSFSPNSVKHKRHLSTRQTQWDEAKQPTDLQSPIPQLKSNDPMRMLVRGSSVLKIHDHDIIGAKTDDLQNETNSIPPSHQVNVQMIMSNHLDMARYEHETRFDLPVTSTTWKEILININAEDGWCLLFVLFIVWFNCFNTFVGTLFTIVAYLVNRSTTHSLKSFKSVVDVGSMFHDTTYKPWLSFCLFTIVTSFFAILVYRHIASSKIQAWRNGENNGVEDPWAGQIGPGTSGKDSVDQIPYPNGYPSALRVKIGWILSAFIFLSGLTLNLVFNYNLEKSTQNSSNAISASILSIILVIFTFMWQIICLMTSQLECHRYISVQKKSDFIKTFVFRVITSFSMLAVKNWNIRDNQSWTEANYDSNSASCGLSTIGDDLIILILVDGVSECALKLVGTRLQKWIFGHFSRLVEKVCRCFGVCVEEFLPVFDSSDEYVQVLTRQPLVLLASISRPLFAPAAGFIISIAVYWLNKYKILRIARPSIRTSNSYLTILPILWFASMAAAIFIYPIGAMWILSGSQLRNNGDCKIF